MASVCWNKTMKNPRVRFTVRIHIHFNVRFHIRLLNLYPEMKIWIKFTNQHCHSQMWQCSTCSVYCSAYKSIVRKIGFHSLMTSFAFILISLNVISNYLLWYAYAKKMFVNVRIKSNVLYIRHWYYLSV